jgi:hypothetical protein
MQSLVLVSVFQSLRHSLLQLTVVLEFVLYNPQRLLPPSRPSAPALAVTPWVPVAVFHRQEHLLLQGTVPLRG